MEDPAAEQEKDWPFPIYVGHTRRLLPTDELFQDSSYPHDEIKKYTARAAAKEKNDSHELQERALLRDYRYLVPKNECTLCRALLPTAHILDLHLSEVHDSFFAAQAARKMPVYACLVESCEKKFGSIEQRKQHLMDYHKFPKGYSLDRIHLRRKKGQIRPLPQYRKNRNNQINSEQEKQNAAQASPPHSAGKAAEQPMDEDLAEGMSRLHMSAPFSAVPRSVAFGHRRGGFMPGLVTGRKGSRGGGRSAGGGRGGEGGTQGSTGGDNDDKMTS
ncbi:hypothetical protein NADE_003070 [Nannochloris sp. 'desiccata']|nr:hypothetical protein NADE_003070 [Chlorella desiccata (nom. nud.)]